jgi:hypothetical protein
MCLIANGHWDSCRAQLYREGPFIEQKATRNHIFTAKLRYQEITDKRLGATPEISRCDMEHA